MCLLLGYFGCVVECLLLFGEVWCDLLLCLEFLFDYVVLVVF